MLEIYNKVYRYKSLIIVLIILTITIILPACDKHLDNKRFTNGDIAVNWYKISTITTVHDYVDLSRWGHTKNIMEANTGGIYDIAIRKDTIVIQIDRNLFIYDLSAKTLGCYIKLDTLSSQ